MLLQVVLAVFCGSLVGFTLGLIGMRVCNHLAPRRAALNKAFAGLVFVVATYMAYHNLSAFSET